MSRHDLPHGFGGWQATDPTPAPYHNQKNCSGIFKLKLFNSAIKTNIQFGFIQFYRENAAWTDLDGGSSSRTFLG